MTDVSAALRQFAALKEIGVRIAIDDFGTGYSSLGHLQELPVDFLKLDKSFTDNITESVKSQELMRTVAQLSRALSIATVAEGVETLEQADVLNTLDVNLCQGFYFARPIDADGLSRMLKRVRRLPETVGARGSAPAAGGRTAHGRGSQARPDGQSPPCPTEITAPELARFGRRAAQSRPGRATCGSVPGAAGSGVGGSGAEAVVGRRAAGAA